MKKEETKFRENKVTPFLKTLRNTAFFPIQQLAIRGDADFHLCVHGTFVALELKSRGEVARPLQEHKHDRVRRAGGVALVASPDNWEEVKQQLINLDGGIR